MMNKRIQLAVRTCLTLALIAGWSLDGAWAQAPSFDAGAKQAILVDFDTGAVLFEKNADEIMFPASMTKMMTAYVAFRGLERGTLRMEDELPISEEAWRMGGSKMFVEVGKTVTVEDLLRGIIVQSGNDASIVVAEAISGSEAAFGDLMTEIGREIGMENTQFRNATGWPDEEHYTTARDLAILAHRIIADFPEEYEMFSEKSFTYADIKQGNRNPLLYRDIGADGLKTGSTDASGYGLTGSALRNGRRLIMVLNGLENAKVRSQESARLMRWGFREFENYALFDAGEGVDDVEIWLGDKPGVGLELGDGPLTITVPRGSRKNMKVKVVYDGPVPAPVAKGDELAKLVITLPDAEPIERPLYAMADVGQLGVFGRLGSALRYLIFGAGSE